MLEAFRARRVVVPITVKRSTRVMARSSCGSSVDCNEVVALRWRSGADTPPERFAGKQPPSAPKQDPQTIKQPSDENKYQAVNDSPQRMSDGLFAKRACADLKMLRSQTIPGRSQRLHSAPLHECCESSGWGQIVAWNYTLNAREFWIAGNMDRYNEKVKATSYSGSMVWPCHTFCTGVRERKER